ncbi:hypothetical protein VZ94_10380 [Methylocucumis oryzae]|uniref:Condensation domain-containing protein n=1 Tax=Methylocucumis oryzae TaxID=1632867 RepID=A0A0F3IIG7_9GAMM|nr:hypothetical protein VZ94_10380 [Methylocucumis oryzae]
MVNQLIEQPFDLANDVLCRIKLFKRSETEHFLVLSLHHIITDGWSMRILLRDLTEAYQAYNQGQLPQQAVLAFDYATFAAWEREAMSDAKVADEVAYWQAQLAGYSNLDMPLDFVRPAQSSGQGAYLQFALTQAQGAAIKQRCRALRTTGFTLFMAAVYVLLRQYSRQSDMCLGMPVANRHQQELEDIVGFFVNTAVMRLNPSSDVKTVAQLLSYVHEVMVAGQDHQRVPIEKNFSSVTTRARFKP